jgi:excisionase family DNA binding protein
MAINPDGDLPLAYRVKDFCSRIGISASTFWKLVSRGEIRVVRIGGRTLVPASEVTRLLSGEAA